MFITSLLIIVSYRNSLGTLKLMNALRKWDIYIYIHYVCIHTYMYIYIYSAIKE
jgi:hypothetical protein